MSPKPQNVVYDAAKKKAMWWLLELVAPFALPVLGVLAFVFVAAAAFAGSPSSSTGDGAPAEMLTLYQSDIVKQECPGLSWTVVAAIVHIESNDNRNPGISSAGARGPSQFLPTTWDSQGQLIVNIGQPYGRVPDGQGYGLDGDGDGLADIMNPYDAVPATARLLCANGGGNPATLSQAIFSYNHSQAYVDQVLSLARTLEAGAQGNGAVLVAAGANLPGQPIQPETMAFLQRVAGIYGKPITCTTGTSHSEFTVDGNVSDHFDGHACDFGMNANGGYDDSPVGDAIATACLIAAGDSPTTAAQEAFVGGLYTRDNAPNGDFGPMRVQCIWKTFEGGNHHNHVHIGARPEG